MALFAKLFGGGEKGGKAPSPQEAIQKLRETEEMLMKKQEYLEKKIDAELLTAKKNGTKNKRGKTHQCYRLVRIKSFNQPLLCFTTWWLLFATIVFLSPYCCC